MNVALPNVIELCAGYGGIGLGLTLAIGEVRNLVFVEREISVARVLVARFQDGSLAPADIWTDVKTFDGRPYRGKTDILCAGYPCQPFSCAGKQLAERDPRHLPGSARLLRWLQVCSRGIYSQPTPLLTIARRFLNSLTTSDFPTPPVRQWDVSRQFDQPLI